MCIVVCVFLNGMALRRSQPIHVNLRRWQRAAFPSAQISRQQPDAQTQSSWDLTTPEVERLIEEKLSSESALENAKIDVRTDDTIVELTGIAASARQRELAGEIAKSYSGDRRIENRIQVSGL